MKGKDYKQDSWLHRLVYRLVRFLIQAYYLPRYRYRPERVKTEPGGNLILCNHVAGADPMLIGIAFLRPLYFVASEHLLRRKIGPLMMKLQAPIIRLKGLNGADAVTRILRRLRDGHDVCLFVEGERSYDGCTMEIAASAARLAKMSGKPLLLYRLHGAYLSHPRWAKTRRRGRISGVCAERLSAGEIKSLSLEELQQRIISGIFADAYADQERELIAYRGKRLAEDLETALFICPACSGIGTLKSAGDSFGCDCGLSLLYDEYGYFKSAAGNAPPFANVRDWYAWQQRAIEEIAFKKANSTSTEIFGDSEQDFFCGLPGGALGFLGRGRLALYGDGLALVLDQGHSLRFALHAIQDIACEDQMRLSFVCEGRVYEVLSPYPRSAVKYQLLFRALKRLVSADDFASGTLRVSENGMTRPE